MLGAALSAHHIRNIQLCAFIATRLNATCVVGLDRPYRKPRYATRWIAALHSHDGQAVVDRCPSAPLLCRFGARGVQHPLLVLGQLLDGFKSVFLRIKMQFMNPLKIPRIQAALIHLAISACVAALALGLVFKIWYPAPWADALGVGKIFLIILGVDLCLGPLLTLVVYKVGKSNLHNDLIVIACIQIAALLYGMHTVGLGRPAYLVFSKDRFDLVLAHEVYRVDNFGSHDRKKLTLLEQNPWVQPLWGLETVGSSLPKENALQDLLTSTALAGIADAGNVLELRLPYAAVLPQIQATAIKLANYSPKLEKNKAQLKKLQAKYPFNAIASPVKVKFEILTAVLNPSDGAILGIEAVDIFE